MTEEVTTTHLVMDSPDQLRPRLLDDPEVGVALVAPPNPQLNHSLFMEIGTPYRWYSRLDWRHQDWKTYVENPLVQTWIGVKAGLPFGYYELEHYDSGTSRGVTEILFFGLYASYVGMGLGAHLLTEAVRSAWAFDDTKQVYVHTCTNDHPSALGNYTARGFRVDRTETKVETIPDPGDPVLSSPAYYRSLGPEG